ncbi:MAG: PepSY domain-containing protein [Thaumarchaeota archaeon]|nr:PepSY domain-containing protein [Nitrososphaerota archaeon]
MNTQALKTHQKMFAMILGVAVIAAVGGSMAYAQTAPSTGSGSTYTPIQGSVNIPQVILSNVKVNFVDAANTAAKQITGGQVLSGDLVIQNGYAVYAFKVTDGKSVYSVIVDAGNGQVLKTSQGRPLSSLAFGGMGMGHGMMHKHMAGTWSKAPTGTTPPSTTTPSGFQE